MKKLTIQEAELLAQKFRFDIGLSQTEPINVKTVLRKLHIITLFRPLSPQSYGVSIRTEHARFMLVNSNSTIGRQYFTIAHELYHLFYDKKPEPHICIGTATGEEKNANLFASALLMPKEGLLQEITPEEMYAHKVDMAKILRLEQLFAVSRKSLLIRLKSIRIISEDILQELINLPIKDSAYQYGYDTSLYEPGNEGLVIGDFGEKAHQLFEEGKISEGHYWELLNLIHYGKSKD